MAPALWGFAMKKMCSLLLVFSMATAFCQPALGLDNADIRQILSERDSAEGPGCAAGVFRNGAALYTATAGYGDIANRRPLDADTLFYSASIAKQFTALAVAGLAERGKLSLDDDVRKYLPELPRYEAPVTIRMLLSHSSGIGDMLGILRQAGFGSPSQADRKTALQLQLRQTHTNFKPGTAYSYSNGGYLLLSEIVARVTGVPFPRYMKQAVFEPLGMTHTYVLDDAKPQGSNIAHGYGGAKDGFDLRDDYPNFGGSGGIMISVNDFAKMDRDAVTGHRLWTPFVEHIMTTPGEFTDGKPVLDESKGLYYTAGLMVGWRRGQYFIEHSGSADGFVHLYERLPARGLSVIIFCNRADGRPQEKADSIVQAVEGDILTTQKPAPAKQEISQGGSYVCDEVKARYELSLSGDTLTAKTRSTISPTANATIAFNRNPDGSYSSRREKLTFDQDARGFTLHTSGTPDVHFNRTAD
jgi:CubicO group peptidase (beta-lactamase class C family)